MKIKRYQPGASSYAPRRSEEEWREHQQLLTRLHQQHYTRKQMLASLKQRDFEVSSGQLLAQMKKWDLVVYNVSAPAILDQTGNGRNCPCSPDIADVAMLSASPESATTNAEKELDDTVDAGFMGDLRLVVSEPEPSSDDVVEGLQQSQSLEVYELPVGDIVGLDVLESVDHRVGNSDIVSSIDAATPDRQTTGIGVHPIDMSFLNTSILLQLPAIVEPWCEVFSSSCSCKQFFSGDGSFRKSPELYRAVMKQSSTASLKYIVALFGLLDCKVHPMPDSNLQDDLWQTIEFYLQVCTRVDRKNRLATRILHSLLRAWETGFGDRVPFTDVPFRSFKADSRATLVDRIMKTKCPSSIQDTDGRRGDWQQNADRDISTVVGFTARRPSTFPLVDWAGDSFGSAQSWNAAQEPGKAPVLAETAGILTAYMQEQWSMGNFYESSKEKNAQPWEALGDCNLSLIFQAMGTMLALELSSYAVELTRTGDFADSNSWPMELKQFIDTSIRTLSLNAEYSQKFKKAYWLVSGDKIGHKGKGLHTGPCSAQSEWQVLERSIHDYTENRTWIERRVFAGRNDWPQTEDLMTSDNMSMRSVSSFNSFKRFQALAFHLKIGTPHSRSLRSKSTKSTRMSLDSHLSWQLEHMLGIEEKEESPLLDSHRVNESLGEEQKQQEAVLSTAGLPSTCIAAESGQSSNSTAPLLESPKLRVVNL